MSQTKEFTMEQLSKLCISFTEYCIREDIEPTIVGFMKWYSKTL